MVAMTVYDSPMQVSHESRVKGACTHDQHMTYEPSTGQTPVASTRVAQASLLQTTGISSGHCGALGELLKACQSQQRCVWQIFTWLTHAQMIFDT